MERVTFYYDVVCPYAYLASTQIEAMAARTGAAIEWVPVLLGGIFRAIGQADVPAAAMPPAKQHLNLLDMKRYADYYGVPL
ncbi:MAG TPA: DsbA family protein, partial [Polyangia bacterium]